MGDKTKKGKMRKNENECIRRKQDFFQNLLQFFYNVFRVEIAIKTIYLLMVEIRNQKTKETQKNFVKNYKKIEANFAKPWISTFATG